MLSNHRLHIIPINEAEKKINTEIMLAPLIGL